MTRLSLRPVPLALAISLALGAAPAFAQPAAEGKFLGNSISEFDLPSQPLGDSLNSLARQLRFQIAVQQSLLSGKVAPTLVGKMSGRQALDRLLAGTGLIADIRGAEVIIRPASASEPLTGVTLAPVTVTAQAELDANSEGTGSYASRGATIFKNTESLREIPQSVSVLTRQRLDDQNLSSLDQVMDQTTGVSKTVADQGSHGYQSRGFQIGTMLVDGAGSYSAEASTGISADIFMYDRIEVLRGATGLLSGNGEPGGTVNFVRKRPLAEKQVVIGVHAGSWNNRRAEIDATGPLNDSGNLRGRVVASYVDQDFFYRKTHVEQPFVYGVIEYDVSRNTMLTGGIRLQSYRRDGADWAAGLPNSTDGSDLRLSRSSSFGPAWSYRDQRTKELFLEAKHEFNDQWNGRVIASWERINWENFNVQRSGRVDPVNLQGSSLVLNAFDVNRRASSLDASITGRFDWLGREHQLTIGANRFKKNNDEIEYKYSGETRKPLDFGNPYQNDWIMPSARVGQSTANLKSISQGLYGIMKFQVTDPLKLIAGGRLAWFDYDLNVGGGAYLIRQKQNREFTPYAGILYDLTKNWTAYASYTDIFKPQGHQYTSSGKPLDPAIGSTYEIGLKGDLLDRRLNTSLALFYTKQRNRALVDPDFPEICPSAPVAGSCYINAGVVQSKGLDIEINGEVTRDMQMWAGYTYNQQIYLKDLDDAGSPSADQGKNFSGSTPRHILRAGASARLPGAFSQWTVGGSVSAISATGYVLGTAYREQRGFAVWSAFARYQATPKWAVTLNLNNLFDRVYYQDAGKSLYGEPRSVTLSLRGTF